MSARFDYIRLVSRYAQQLAEVAGFLDYEGDEWEYDQKQADTWTAQCCELTAKLAQAVYWAGQPEEEGAA